MPYYVYMLECADNTIYVGQTRNLELRMLQREQGSNPRSYTAKRRPVELRWYTSFENREEAVFWEKKFKKWSAPKKRAVIEGRWDDLPGLAECKNETSHKNYKKEG